MMREVEHPNVLRVVDQGEYAECPYYVMEYVQGRTLDALLEDTPRIAIAEILRIAEGVALALRAIHKSNIVHRDIKLKNIYVGDDAEVKLGDFGVAVKIGDARLTQTGYSVGTPIYMAPEQFEGGAVTAATDVYSYGAAMYHLITGKPPFTAANAMELMRKHFTATPAPMCSVRRDLPEEWDILVVDNCLAKNSRDRPQSIEAVLEVLNMIRDISPIQDADC
jgi:serine/threonine protein kinase